MNRTIKIFQWIGKILQGIFISFLICICILSLYIVVSKLVVKNRIPMIFGYALLNIETSSMSPTLDVNDVVLIQKLESNQYEVGMIVAFWQTPTDSIPITHRIVERNGSEITTRGDANNSEDASIDVSNIIGAQVKSFPKLGYVIHFVKSPLGILTLLLFGFLVIETPSLIVQIKKYNSEKKNNNKINGNIPEEK